MRTIKRVENVAAGIVMLIASIILMVSPESGYEFVVVLIDITFLLYGIKMLIYYFTMARFMVGGIMTLYKSIIAIDFGLFVFYMQNTPKRLTMLYLVGLIIFNGVVALLGAFEAKRIDASFWKSRMIKGMVSIVFAIVCLCFWNSAKMVTIIYGISLIYEAFYRIGKAFRRTAIIHIG